MTQPTQGRSHRWVAPVAGTLLFTLAALALLAHRARAYVDELMLDAGAGMLAHPDADQTDAPRTLLVNGLRFHLTSAGTGRTLPDVLDLFHARCRERGGRLDAEFARLPRARALAERLAPSALDTVLRHDDGERGYVACLDLGGAPVPPEELLRRTRRFLGDGDLAHVGDLRVVFAVREGARTSYLALWTDGPLPLSRAFPARGDAPGHDLPGLPRPPDTRRLLSAHQLGNAPMIAAYRAKNTTREALATRYRAAISRAGLRVRSRPGVDAGFVVERADSWWLVALSADGSDALATIVPL